jgi:hypothetical protein
VAAVVLTAGGFVAGRFVRSPAELAAEAQPPEPSLITADVVRGRISKTVIARGDVVPAKQVSIAAGGGWLAQSDDLGVSSGVVGPSAGGGVLTGSFVSVGDQVLEGQAVVEVAGRPLFVLQGDVPLTRDLRPGATGGDVRRLQEALCRLGFFAGPVSGVFDADTRDAVAALYHSAGYTAAATDGGSGADDDALAAADRTVEQARDALAGANLAVAGARDQVASAQTAVGRAERVSQESQPGSATASDEAQAEDDLAEANRALAAAQRGLAAAESAVTAAGEDVTWAVEARDRLRARVGVVVPMAEVGFAPSLPAAVTAVAVEVGFAAPACLLTLTPDALVVRVEGLVGVGSGMVSEGDFVELAMSGGETRAGQVTAVSPAAGGGLGWDVEIAPSEPLAVALAGENLKVTFMEATTSGEVLGVPQGAIGSDSAGVLSVAVVDGIDQASGRPILRRVEVVVGVTGIDLVEVTPVQTGELAEGMKVVIGG